MKDFLLKDGDIQIVNGDFVIDESDVQNIELLIKLSKGNIKQYPSIGYGEERLLNGVMDAKARRDIQESILVDGYQLKYFEVSDDNHISVRI